MAEFIFMIVLGAILLLLGIFNFQGNIASIHWYNRRKVSKENQKPYCRWMGIGTGIIGISLIVAGILRLTCEREEYSYIIMAGAAIGLGSMLYAQFKYNRGLF